VVRVMVDTNIAGGARDRPLESNVARRLLDETRRGNLRLVLPEVVIREAANLWAEKVLEHMRGARSAEAFLLRAGVSADLPRAVAEKTELRRGEEDRIRLTLAEAGAEVAPLPSCDHELLVERALLRRQPFDSRGRDGYRDVLIWESLLELDPDAGPVILLARDKRAFFEDGREEKGLSELLRGEAGDAFGPGRVHLFFEPAAGIEKALAIGVEEQRRMVRRAADEEAESRLEELLGSEAGFRGTLAYELGEALEFLGLGGDLRDFGILDGDVYDSHVAYVLSVLDERLFETHVVEDGTVLTKLSAGVVAVADATMSPSVATALEGQWQVLIRDRGNPPGMITASIEVGIRVTADLQVDLSTRRLAAPPAIVMIEPIGPEELLDLVDRAGTDEGGDVGEPA
jgi:hypothetical protein